MSAAGDAVLAEAQRWIGTTEYPPGSNAGPWWDSSGFGGINYGSWCAAFVSMVVNNALGYGAMCAVDSDAGFMLVSNGVQHAYHTGDDASPTGLEAQRTPDLQPGDVVNYSWEAWRWEGTPGAGGYPVCDGGPYDGWPAGDHTGIVQSAPDSAGYFTAVEGNTSVNGSQDNGGAVLERTRHVSQVCSWWRPIGYSADAEGIVEVAYTYTSERIDVVGANTDGHLWHKWYAVGGTWQPGGQNDPFGWEHLTGGMADAELANTTGGVSCEWFAGQFHVWYARRDGNVQHLFHVDGTGWVREFFPAGNITTVASAAKDNIAQVAG